MMNKGAEVMGEIKGRRKSERGREFQADKEVRQNRKQLLVSGLVYHISRLHASTMELTLSPGQEKTDV